MKRCIYLTFLLVCLLTGSKLFAQNIQIGGTFNTGVYGRGSNITVPITISGVFNQTEKFEIWLSDASGNFTSATKIGEYQSFFSTFVNGIIPIGTPDGSGYQIQVRASTTGANIATTPAFSVSGSQAVIAKISPSSSLTVFKSDEIFGRCLPNTNGVIFTVQSTPSTAITTVSTKNEISGRLVSGNLIDTLLKSYYTVTVTSTQNGIIGTRSYSIINTDNTNPFQSTYTSPVCINPDDPDSGGITFRVNIDSGADVYKNYPGTKYVIDWSDGTVQTLTLAEIIALNGRITHLYTSSSCNQSVQSNGVVYNNSFGIQSKAINPYCAEGAPTINIARAFEMPKVAIQNPGFACKNALVTFVNKSTQGAYGSENQQTCTASNIFYDWYVDGNLVLSNVNVNTNLNYTFTTPGTHTVTLVPVDPNSNLPCIPNMVSTSICIEETPVPAFQFNQSGTLSNTLKGCTPLTVVTKNQSSTLNGCGAPFYQWTLVNTQTNKSGFYNNNALFIAGTDSISLEPQFRIQDPGVYSLTLRVSNSCSSVTATQSFTVVGPPSIPTFNYTPAFCDTIPKKIDFNAHVYNANFAPDADLTYLWTVSGGDFEYVNSTSNTSKYPSILFKSYGTYTIKVDYDNGCGSVSKTQTITFNQPLIASITANTSTTDISECTGAVINLAGTISGPAGYTYQWTKSSNASGTLTPGPINAGSPTATYTPVAADDDKQLTFNLVITYPSPVPSTCAASLTKSIKVTYTATNTANPASLGRCSGTAVNFTPTSTITNSEFIWSVVSAGSNITGQADQLSYTRNPINDILLNNGSTPQQVVYRITPRSASGCAGTPFNLTVTVYPELAGNVISDNQVICANQTPAAISQSALQTLTGGSGSYIYLWQQSTDNLNWTTASGTSNQAAYQPAALSASIYYRRTVYSPNLTTCSLISNVIEIKVNPLPDISLATVNEICSTANSFNIPYTNTANSPTHFDLSVGATAMPGFTNLSNVLLTASPIQITIPANVPANTYNFNLIVRNADGCQSTVKSFSLIVKSPPTPASAGTDQSQCNNGTFILGGNTPAVGTGIWTIVSTAANGAVIANPALPGSTLSGLQVGKSVTLRWTISNGTCTESIDEVVLTNVIPTPLARVGANQSLCNNITQAVLSGNIPSGAFVGTWTDVTIGGPGGLVFSPNANTPGATVSGLVAGTEYKLRWTIAGNTPCGDSFAELIIAVRPPITPANAGADSQLCDQTSSNNTFNLNANLDISRSFETGTWTIVSEPAGSNAFFSNANSPSAIVQNLVPGTYRLRWTINNDAAACTISADEMILEVYAKPVGGTLSASVTAVCEGTMSGTLNLAAYTGDIEQWEYASSLTGPWTSIINTTNTYSFPSLSQTTYFRVKVVSKGLVLGCSSSLPAYSNVITVIVNPTTVGGSTAAGTNATVCQGSNTGAIILSGQVGTVTGWEYSINGGSNWLAIANTANQTTYNFSGLTQNTQFRAVVRSGACLTAYSSATTITVLALTQAAVSNIEVCTANTAQIRGNAPSGTEIGTWTQVSGPNTAIFANINNPQTTVSGLLVGTYQFNWTIDNGVCAPSVATLTLNNYPALVNEIQTSLNTICAGQAADLRDRTHTGGAGVYTYQWQSSTDNLSWTTLSGQTLKDLSLVLNTSTYFKRIMVSGPCSAESNVILITVQPPISNNSISQSQEVCIQTPVAELRGTLPQGGDGNYIYTWQQSINGTTWTSIAAATQPDYQPALLSQTTWYRRLVSTLLCSGAQQNISNEIQITVRPNAKAEFTASKTLACIPFNLAGAITVVPHPDLNTSYEWFANNVSIGTGSTFPGYTINTDGEQVTIKLVTISKYACNTDEKSITFETVKSVNASFTLDKTTGCGPLSVTFTNTSNPLNGASFAWDFGNGQTSVSANPSSITFQPHPLNRDTTYTVSLRAYTDCQESVFTANVLVRPQPISVFTPDKTEGCSPFLVNFTNQSKGHPANYEFDFGDGSPVLTTNSLDDVAHTFTVLSNTTFTISLKVSNECGTSTSSYNVRVKPNTITANLVVNGTDKKGCPPHTLTFYNNSVGANQFTWDFGDGSPLEVNTARTMTHTFVNGGVYQVKLTASNGCSVQETTETVTVYPEPISSFTTVKTLYCVDEAVQFQNTSPLGGFYWQFGDGSSSTETNPVHQYALPGTYTVMLSTTVTQTDGTQCTKTVSRQIEVQRLPVPQFTTNAAALNCAPFRLQIQNTSLYADKYAWYIDGVLTSTDKNPANLWLTASNRVITLRLVVENTLGCSTSTEQRIQMYPRPVANFSVLPGPVIKIPEYTFNFQNTTTGTVNGYQWSFGDGSTSTATNPAHTYAELGVYQVTLVARNAEGCTDTLTRQVEIQNVPGYLYVPNAFEPASLVAELKTFKPKGSGIAQYQIRVFNKMGNLLWESSQLDYNNSPAEGWDGTINGQPAPPDVYVWTIDATFINRTTWKGMKYENTDRPKTTGTIHLIR